MSQSTTAEPTPYVKRPSFIVSLAALGALTATAIDVALPAQPLIATSFGERVEAGGIIVSAYFLGYGPGQLIWGPLSDKYGRIPPMMIGLIGFILTTVACIFANSLTMLAFFRFLQGVFGGSTPVIVRAIARDQGGGKETANLIATIIMIFGLAPMIAPIIGSGILTFSNWQSIFWFLVIFALVLMVLAQVYVKPAAKTAEDIKDGRIPLSWGLIKMLFSERDFLVGTGAMAATFAGYSSILAAGAAMAEEKYGITATEFGPLFSIAALAALVGSGSNKRILKNHDVRTPFRISGIILGSAGLGLFFLSQADVSLTFYWGFVSLYIMGFGMMMPSASTIALEPAGKAAGTASSFLSALPTIGGVIGAYLSTSSLFASGYEALSILLATGGTLTAIIILGWGGKTKKA